MQIKRVARQVSLKISIYKKPGNKAEVVFRKSRILHRLGGVEDIGRVSAALKTAVSGTGKAHVVTLRSSRCRRWVVEIVSAELKAVVIVWELLANGTSVVKFIWRGQPSELKTAF